MNPLRKKKLFLKTEFSDEEIYQEIKNDILEIRSKDLKEIEIARQIGDLYELKKAEKKKRKMLEKETVNKGLSKSSALNDHRYSDDEEGEISEHIVEPKQRELLESAREDGVVSISNLGEHIRPITLIRSRIADLLNSRRFEQLIQGCFVRYLSNSAVASTSYQIAQIVGITQGPKTYELNNSRTNLLLKLQETSDNVVTLPIQMVSNQHPPGNLEIERWLQANRNKIPKQAELREKLLQHNKLLVEQLSSVQIDGMIWKNARQAAESGEVPKEDLSNWIDFLADKLHGLQTSCDSQQYRLPKMAAEYEVLKAQLQETIQIHTKLLQLHSKYLEAKKEAEKIGKDQQTKRPVKKHSWVMAPDRTQDSILEKVKARMGMLATYEGYLKFRNRVIASHQKEIITPHQ